jgi:uncharacterized protein (DUF305 family)
MIGSCSRWVAACLVALLTLAGASVTVAQARPGQGAMTPAERARADSGRPPYTKADVDFISGMIGHHAQAVLMASWAPTHGASVSLRALCERILVGQRDEIAFMQRWLRERRQPVPEADAMHGAMAGMSHPVRPLMPGMLTTEQLAQLDSARGREFDRLFLTFMIQHHEGAITMVDQLFGAQGAAQDDAIFKFASDVNADQTTEIDRMTTMLATMSSSERSP